MSELKPWQVILIGFVLVTVGMVLPWLMVLRIIFPTFLLSFVSYTASVIGLLLGVIGSAMYVAGRRKIN